MAASFVVCPPGHSQETPDGVTTNKPAVAEVSVDASKIREPISPYIYGQFIEHLGRCIYGGIWAEMLEDRKFYFPVPADKEIWRLTREQARVLAASPWKVIGVGATGPQTHNSAFGSPMHASPVAGACLARYRLRCSPWVWRGIV
jgi:hypothetical protein